jgi:FdhD protein
VSTKLHGTAHVSVRKVDSEGAAAAPDAIAVEEPMEIRLVWGPPGSRAARSLSVTMRTPGDDFELAAGFLFTEGIVAHRDQIERLEFCGPRAPGRETSNIVRVEVDPSVDFDFARVERHFFATSSCGICGKASIEALEVRGEPMPDPPAPRIAADGVHALPDRLREAQAVFDRTGGLHAAALFDADGTLIDVREDVGRHNAVDKLIGARLLAAEGPQRTRLVLVSGRASFELMQKALMAGIPMLVAVGAPSSLAVEVALRFNMTLIGFARDGRFNVYAGDERIVGAC